MKYVSLQPRPLVWPTSSPAPLLDADTLRSVVAAHSFRDSITVCAMVGGELRRRGYHRAPAGGRLWNAAEERVLSDVVGLELDLSEIAAQIEEAKWERGD